MSDYPIRMADNTGRLLLLPWNGRIATGPGTCPEEEEEPVKYLDGSIVVKLFPKTDGRLPNLDSTRVSLVFPSYTQGLVLNKEIDRIENIWELPITRFYNIKIPISFQVSIFWGYVNKDDYSDPDDPIIYPKPTRMQIWVFNKFCGTFNAVEYTKGNSQTAIRVVASVVVDKNGEIKVTPIVS